MSNYEEVYNKFVDRVTIEQREAIRKARKKPAKKEPHAAVTPLLHAELAKMLKSLGHTDMLLIADGGFPVPSTVPCVALGLSPGIPTIPDVLRAIERDFSFDRIIITSEMKEFSPQFVKTLEKIGGGKLLEGMSHLDFKHLCRRARGAVRTADTTPYGNIILICG